MSMRGVMTLRAWVSPKPTIPHSHSPSSGSRMPSRVPTSMKASISSSEASLVLPLVVALEGARRG